MIKLLAKLVTVASGRMLIQGDHFPDHIKFPDFSSGNSNCFRCTVSGQKLSNKCKKVHGQIDACVIFCIVAESSCLLVTLVACTALRILWCHYSDIIRNCRLFFSVFLMKLYIYILSYKCKLQSIKFLLLSQSWQLCSCMKRRKNRLRQLAY